MLLPKNEVEEIERIEDFECKIHEAAKLYARHGFPIVPLRPGQKILPKRDTGINYHSCTTNLRTINKWFGPDGKWRGCNIGIVCGRDVFVIDLDLHGESNGLEAWEALAAEKDAVACPIQKTPKGGRHLVFQWKEYLASSSGKLGRGIDTRGGDGQPRSHIAAWPSRTEDGEYTWVQFGDVVEPPQWVSDLMGVPWSAKPGRGNEEVGEGDEERKYTLSEIRAMLDFIDPDKLSYEEWLFIGQAINSQHPTDEGRELWDQWSQQGERYEQGECRKRWPGFNPSGPIRMGSLIYFAKQGGFNPVTDPLARTGEFGELVERMNADNAVLLTGGKVRIVHRDKNGGIHIMGTQDFHTLMYNRRVTLATGGKQSGPKSVTEADIWMAHEARRECINGMGFFPNQDLWYDGYVNMWQGWGVEPAPGDWSLFRDHVLNILCRSNEELFTFVLDWVADILQDPMRPKGTAIVLHGKEGTGKGTFCHMVGAIIGDKHYKHVTNERHLTGNFNYHLMDGLLIFADEVIYGGSRSTAGILKSIVTEKELVCERKGIDSFMYENRSRLVIASNEDWFIPAGPESRRWLVLDVADDKANDRKYFDAIYRQMQMGGYSGMMHDLLNRKITSNLHVALETEALEHQRSIYRATGDAVDQWLDYCISIENLGCVDEEGKNGGWPEDVDRIELFQSFNTWLANHKGLRTKGSAHFYKKVEEYGFIKHRPGGRGAKRKWRYKVPLLSRFKKKG